MKLNYKKVKVEDLKPGDMFVNSTPEEMDMLIENELGVSVFVKTNKGLEPGMPVISFDEVLKVTIKKNDKKSS